MPASSIPFLAPIIEVELEQDSSNAAAFQPQVSLPNPELGTAIQLDRLSHAMLVGYIDLILDNLCRGM
jgi:hypothetical protein